MRSRDAVTENETVNMLGPFDLDQGPSKAASEDADRRRLRLGQVAEPGDVALGFYNQRTDGNAVSAEELAVPGVHQVVGPDDPAFCGIPKGVLLAHKTLTIGPPSHSVNVPAPAVNGGRVHQ